MSHLKVAATASASAVGMTALTVIAFWGGKTPAPLAVTALTALATGYYGYTGKAGTYRRGLLYGAAFVPAVLGAVTTADYVDSMIAKSKPKAVIAGDDPILAIAREMR